MASSVIGRAFGVYQAKSGNSYTADATGYIGGIANGDIGDLINMGCALQSVRNNLSATTDPSVSNDGTQGYAAGSRWINTTSGLIWVCAGSATGAAVWMPENLRFIGRLLGANMNVTTDQPIPLFLPATARFRVTKITAQNASANLTTAQGGVYPAASKGGTATVANTQAYTALSAASKAVDLTLANTDVLAAGTLLYLSLTTGQGAPSTADIYVYGDPYL